MNNRSRILLAASLASALALPVAIAQAGQKTEDTQAKVHCYGVNKCKGVGDCGGQGHDCAGKNACKGQGFIEMDKETCLKLEGGRLTEAK